MDGTMRAVVYHGVGLRPGIEQVPAPECPPDGAIVRVEATGVCRSDWHAWRGHDPVTLPHIPGHEFAGTVAEIGHRVGQFAVGTRVTAPFVNGCGACDWCRVGDAQVCPDQTQPGFTHPGSFAEYVVVRAADFNLVRLPEHVDAVTAASLGCRFATAFRALTSHTAVGPGTEVAVFGCGGVGLSAVMIAAASGARVTAVDPSPTALARAAEVGAATTIRSDDPVPEVVAATGGGAHLSMDALGSPGTADASVRCLRRRGTADASVRCLRRRGTHVQVGLMLGAAAAAPLPWDRVIAWEITVVGSHGMAAADYPGMLAMVADGRLRPGDLVGSVVDLNGAADALVAMDEPGAGSGMVVAHP